MIDPKVSFAMPVVAVGGGAPQRTGRAEYRPAVGRGVIGEIGRDEGAFARRTARMLLRRPLATIGRAWSKSEARSFFRSPNPLDRR